MSTEEETARARVQYIEDIRTLVAVPAGKRFFRQLFEDGYIFRTTFTGNSQGFFLEGHRNLALKIFQDVCEAAPEAGAAILLERSDP